VTGLALGYFIVLPRQNLSYSGIFGVRHRRPGSHPGAGGLHDGDLKRPVARGYAPSGRLGGA